LPEADPSRCPAVAPVARRLVWRTGRSVSLSGDCSMRPRPAPEAQLS
jgi:hypothetical protein